MKLTRISSNMSTEASNEQREVTLNPEIKVSSDWTNLTVFDGSVDKVGNSVRNHASAICVEYPTYANDIMVLCELFTKEECKALIHERETFGFGETNYPKSYRGNLRLRYFLGGPGLAAHSTTCPEVG